MTIHVDASALAFERRDDRRVVFGVAGGFADQHGVDVIVVRAALVMLTFAGGLGIVLYVLGHLLAENRTSGRPARQKLDQRRNLAVAAMSLGATLIMRSTGVWLGDSVMVVVVVVVSGVALLGVLRPRADPVDDVAMSRGGDPSALAAFMTGRHARWRIFAGAVLIAGGLMLVGGRGGVSTSVRVGTYATALTILGVAVLLGPWFARVAQEVAEQRRQRIRLDEREAMATHLHDSVLQTLALIQRNAADPRRTVTLARRQEAELRGWLYGNPHTAATTLSGSLQLMVSEVEDLYDIRIEHVVVGDRLLDDFSVALIAATREACVNAAKHSGVQDVSVYVEVGAGRIEAFVRDRGTGFDRARVPPQGRGIAHSIEARLARVGGSSTIDSGPGRGTEVRMSVPATVESAPTGESTRS